MINGKTIMSWNVPAFEDGDPEKFADGLVSAGFEGVCLKAANGPYVHTMQSYSPWPDWGENVTEILVEVLRDRNLLVYLWQFLYGYYPTGELNVAKAQCERFKPDGWIWNAEGSFDGKPTAVANALLLGNGLRDSNPDVDQGLCWWALPKSPRTGTEWHPIKVANAFLLNCDVGMPMMYWQGIGASAATEYLASSTRVWRSFTDVAMNPIGRAYNGDGGYADGPGIEAFGNTIWNTQELNTYVGNSWYVLDKAFKYPDWWLALSVLPKWWEGFISIDQKIDRLVLAHRELFPELFPEGS